MNNFKENAPPDHVNITCETALIRQFPIFRSLLAEKLDCVNQH